MPTSEGYELDSRGDVVTRPNQPGWVNTECGYNPNQIKVGLPSNLPMGNCSQDPRMTQFNENLFTQIVTPGVYSNSQVNQPINSNIGISFQQQFEPTTISRDEYGIHYTLHDPRIIEPSMDNMKPNNPNHDNPNYDNVYDPRFYGYGTSYRSYMEPVTGQPRFLYDDINAIRMPNYVTRSKVDHLPFADSYGPMQPNEENGNIHTPHMHALAQDAFMRDSLQFRDDLSEARMRKINAEHWQRRQSPLGPKQFVHKVSGRVN